LTTLGSFGFTNGVNPFSALVQGLDGDFYGTTVNGVESSTGYGTVFKVTTNGVITTLASFKGTNGNYPLVGLTLGKDAHFYGATYAGGTGGCPDRGVGPGCGTVFQVT